MQTKHKTSLTIVALTILLLVISVINYDIQKKDSTGKIITQVNIVQTASGECNFQMYSGYNLVSFFCIGLFVDRDEALASINGTYEKIFTYDAGNTVDPWKSYNPSLPNWTIQQLDHMSRSEAYWIQIINSSTYFYNGSVRQTSIQFVPGWNLVSYPKRSSQNISDILQNISFTEIKNFDALNQTYYVYYNSSGNGSLLTLDTFYGYWINSNATQTWVVDG